MEGVTIAWFELYDELRSKIKSGELRAEAEIDRSVASNASDADFDRVVERLVDEGLLRRSAGQLTIAKTRARSRRSASFQEDYTAQGRIPTTKIISLELTPLEDCPAFVQEALKDSDCSMLARNYHLQLVDGVPHAIADSYVPYELIGKHWKNIKTGNQDVFSVFDQLGLHVTDKQETLFVDSPTLPEREHLAIVSMPGVPIVRLNCIVWANTQVVEVCLLCDRADLYEFTYRIKV